MLTSLWTEPGATLLDLADLKDEFEEIWGVRSTCCRPGG